MDHPLVNFYELYCHTHFYPDTICTTFEAKLCEFNELAAKLHYKYWVWNPRTFSYELQSAAPSFAAITLHTAFVPGENRLIKLTAISQTTKKITHWDLCAFDEVFFLGEPQPLKASHIRILEEQAVISG